MLKAADNRRKNLSRVAHSCVRASSSQSPEKKRTSILTLYVKKGWMQTPQSCSEWLSAFGLWTNIGDSILLGRRGETTFNLVCFTVWPPFGTFECVTEPGLGRKILAFLVRQSQRLLRAKEGEWRLGLGRLLRGMAKWAIVSTTAEQGVF